MTINEIRKYIEDNHVEFSNKPPVHFHGAILDTTVNGDVILILDYSDCLKKINITHGTTLEDGIEIMKMMKIGDQGSGNSMLLLETLMNKKKEDG